MKSALTPRNSWAAKVRVRAETRHPACFAKEPPSVRPPQPCIGTAQAQDAKSRLSRSPARVWARKHLLDQRQLRIPLLCQGGLDSSFDCAALPRLQEPNDNTQPPTGRAQSRPELSLCLVRLVRRSASFHSGPSLFARELVRIELPPRRS